MTLARRIACALAIVLTSGCTSTALMHQPAVDQLLRTRATTGPLAIAEGQVLTDNDAAFAAKLRVVESARAEIDLAYYIFSDDYSSSRLSQALIDAAGRGVRVRLLVDYLSAYKDLDRFSWLEAQGAGRIQVRLYNRPSTEILKDAAFLTLGCAAVGLPGAGCDEQKVAAINAVFDPESPGGPERLNRSMAGSGLFLSGLYGKNPKLMAYAVTQGQSIDRAALAAGAAGADSARTEQLKQLGKLYFKARFLGGVEGLEARFKLAFIRLAFAETVNPVFDAINGYLPVGRQKAAEAQQDWDYLTEFLHHKFLLGDRQTLVSGGRNVEDSYHLNPGPLSSKYTFMDTDVRLRFAQPVDALTASFDRLWNLGRRVASISEVRLHAPNDLLENFDAVSAALDACEQGRDQPCVDREVERRFVALPERLQRVAERHRQQLQRFAAEYRAIDVPPLTLDALARVHYLENLPLFGDRRGYGARHDREAESNKNIHALWRAAFQQSCAATGPARRKLVFHNAYLFLPANLLHDIAASLDGTRPCGGVDLTLLTNSLATTDLNIVNLLATWQLKALADHLRESGSPATAARLRYVEYLPVPGGQLSLHSKVMLFDDEIFIGSANADVRSLMMDSNNGLLITGAPAFARAMHQRIDELLASPGRVVDRTALLGRDAGVLGAETDQLADQLLARYAGPDRLSAQQRADLKQDLQATTARVYELSRRIMRGERKAADEFNALFKTI